MEDIPVIPGFLKAVFKVSDTYTLCKSTSCQAVRRLLTKYLKEESVAYQQLMRIPSDKHLLVECCSKGYIELLSVFIKHNFPVNCSISPYFPLPTDYIQTMLHFAARNLQLPLIKYLVSCGADVNARSSDGTALYDALSCKRTCHNTSAIQIDVVKFLLEAGSQTDDIDNFWGNPLYLAITEDNIECAKLLIKYGACINGKGDHFLFESPLYFAASENSVRFVKLLIEEGANVNNVRIKNGNTALSCAARSGNFEILLLLLNSGADLNLRYSGGNTVFHIAMRNSSQKSIELLLERGADMDSKNEDNATPLYLYVFLANKIRDDTERGFVSEDGINKVGTLVMLGANTNITDVNGRNLLHWAAWQGSVHLVKLLMERGLDVKDEFNKKPIHYARDAGHDNIVQFFIDYYCDKFIV